MGVKKALEDVAGFGEKFNVEVAQRFTDKLGLNEKNAAGFNVMEQAIIQELGNEQGRRCIEHMNRIEAQEGLTEQQKMDRISKLVIPYYFKTNSMQALGRLAGLMAKIKVKREKEPGE